MEFRVDRRLVHLGIGKITHRAAAHEAEDGGAGDGQRGPLPGVAGHPQALALWIYMYVYVYVYISRSIRVPATPDSLHHVC